MILVGNALVIGFFMRWHSYQVFRQEDRDLAAFTIAQRKEHDVKEEIKTKEGVKSWNSTAYAAKNAWSKSNEEATTTSIMNLLK